MTDHRNVPIVITRKSDGAIVLDAIASLVSYRSHARKGQCVYVALNATWCCDYPLSEYAIAIAADHGPTRLDAYCNEAYLLGQVAAENAATWSADGNSDPEQIRRVIAMLDDGDPQADDHLPAHPTLSGEWAGDPTGQSLAQDIIGVDDVTIIDAETVDAIADAWQDAVSATFQIACEAELHRWVD